MSDNSDRESSQILLSNLPAGRRHIRLASLVVLCLAAALAVTAPFATQTLEGSAPLLPAYGAAVLINELITAALLFAMFSVQRSRGLFILAVAYLFCGLLVIPWSLTFPGVFSQTGLLDAGLQSTATIAAFRRIGFPLLLLLYAFLRDPAAEIRAPEASLHWRIAVTVAAVIATVCALTYYAVEGGGLLPRWMADEREIAAAWQYVPPFAIALSLAAGAVLMVTRPLSVLNLWLLVVLFTVVIETLLLGYLSGGSRFSLGWWAGRFYGLAASSIVLLALLSESVTLYVRLARSLIAERRSREERLSMLEILSASIAHEVSQPLGSMVTNADAALRWVDRPQPDLGETRSALQRIAEDGHRAGKVIESVRTMFKNALGESASLDLNVLLAEALQRTVEDVRPQRLVIQADLDSNLPKVTGDPLRLGQVARNLFANAAEAMAGQPERPAVLAVTTRLDSCGMVLVTVKDGGSGLTDTVRRRLFEPFFTTKREGLGMGLLFCRSVVERHGGRLWAADNPSSGAVFCFTLPADDDAEERV
ncbi:MAG: hypothetical protein Tsb0032_25410 [Kiloniellaceae bacterium]